MKLLEHYLTQLLAAPDSIVVIHRNDQNGQPPQYNVTLLSDRQKQQHLGFVGNPASAQGVHTDLVLAVRDAADKLPIHQPHSGTHPVFENTCDDHTCWCHKATCHSKVACNGEQCDCGSPVRTKERP